MMTCGPGTQHKAAVAIGAFHEILVAHFQIDARMAQRRRRPPSQATRVESTSMISGASTGMGHADLLKIWRQGIGAWQDL